MKKVYSPRQRKKGFTLLEILIASGIFAAVMVSAVGIFSMGSNYSVKMREMRNVNQGSRKLANMITDDVRQANNAGILHYYLNDGTNQQITYNNGIALMHCGPASGAVTCGVMLFDKAYNSPIAMDSSYAGTTNIANTLIIFNKNWTKVYSSMKDVCRPVSSGCTPSGWSLYYKQYPASTTEIKYASDFTAPDSTFVNKDLFQSSNMISQSLVGSADEIRVLFSGYAQYMSAAGVSSSNLGIQPYINFHILAQSATATKDYAGLPVYRKFQTEVVSTVTSRNYGP